MNNKKSTTIRFDMQNFEYIKTIGKLNNRTISGQANWICRISQYLEDNLPGVYMQIVSALNEETKAFNKSN